MAILLLLLLYLIVNLTNPRHPFFFISLPYIKIKTSIYSIIIIIIIVDVDVVVIVDPVVVIIIICTGKRHNAIFHWYREKEPR